MCVMKMSSIHQYLMVLGNNLCTSRLNSAELAITHELFVSIQDAFTTTFGGESGYTVLLVGSVAEKFHTPNAKAVCRDLDLILFNRNHTSFDDTTEDDHVKVHAFITNVVKMGWPLGIFIDLQWICNPLLHCEDTTTDAEYNTTAATETFQVNMKTRASLFPYFCCEKYSPQRYLVWKDTSDFPKQIHLDLFMYRNVQDTRLKSNIDNGTLRKPLILCT